MTRQNLSANLSNELLAAQERLLALRQEFAQQKAAAGQSSGLGHPGIGAIVSQLPPHLGWESAAVTAALVRRIPLCRRQTTDDKASSTIHRLSSIPDNESDGDSDWDKDVRLHPAIGLGMLRVKKTAGGRLWLLLRVIDRQGQGWVDLEIARRMFSGPDAPYRICGPRQFRNLLAQGEGIFWEKRGQRLWLRSVPRVAAALGVERLDGRPIALPRPVLTQSIGKVRAHLYAAFHSGRRKDNPISRAALTRISRVSPRTQQTYERKAGVRKQRNYATGPRLNSSQAQELAWQKGSACFTWHDRQGTHGSETATFLAWQLPNSYNGPHEQRPNGNRKKFNRQLADLSTKGMTGNGRPAVEYRHKRFCDTAKAAVQSANYSKNAVYWRGSAPGSWYVMKAEETCRPNKG